MAECRPENGVEKECEQLVHGLIHYMSVPYRSMLMNKWRLRNSHTWLVGLVEHTFFFNIISNGKGTIFPKCFEKDHPNVDE